MLNDVYVNCAVIHSSKEYFFAIELLQIWTTAPCDNLEGSTHETNRSEGMSIYLRDIIV